MAVVTPLSPLPVVGFSLTLPDAVTVVEASTAPFNNTKEIIVYNPSVTDNVLIQIADLGVPPALPAAAAVTAANSIVLPTRSAVTLCIGPEGVRNPMGTVAFWTANGPGANLNVVFKLNTATVGAVSINITYVQCSGGSAGGCG